MTSATLLRVASNLAVTVALPLSLTGIAPYSAATLALLTMALVGAAGVTTATLPASRLGTKNWNDSTRVPGVPAPVTLAQRRITDPPGVAPLGVPRSVTAPAQPVKVSVPGMNWNAAGSTSLTSALVMVAPFATCTLTVTVRG